ncbi:MAG: glycine zipper 2TM domain-containing protein [Pontixanthobacter sp.]
MKLSHLKSAAIALAAPCLIVAAPAAAADFAVPMPNQLTIGHGAPIALQDEANVEHRRRYRHNHGQSRYDRYDDDDDDYYEDRRYRSREDRRYRGREARYDEPVYRDTRIWRDRDGRYRCRKEDGTTGLLIGGAVGGLIGNELAGRGDRTLGAILGAAGGAILGRTIDRSGSRCR